MREFKSYVHVTLSLIPQWNKSRALIHQLIYFHWYSQWLFQWFRFREYFWLSWWLYVIAKSTCITKVHLRLCYSARRKSNLFFEFANWKAMFTCRVHWFISEIKAGHWFISWYIFTDWISDYFTDSDSERYIIHICKERVCDLKDRFRKH